MESDKRACRSAEKDGRRNKKLAVDLSKLTEEHAKTRRDLEGLAHTFGYVLEDRAEIKNMQRKKGLF